MSTEEFAPDSVPYRNLDDAREQAAYIDMLSSALRAGRLNNMFPTSRDLLATVQVLHPQRHRGLYDGLQVDERSGLPTYREFTRAQTDVRIAADQLRQLGPRAALAQRAANRSEAIHQTQLTKHLYYSDIQNTRLVELGDMSVSLRNVRGVRASFHVVLDKLDATGYFLRHSLTFSQRRAQVAETILIDDRLIAYHTPEFRSAIYRLTSWDVEFTWARLAATATTEVERVIRGSIGPIILPWMPLASLFSSVFEESQSDYPFIACFGTDTIAGDVQSDNSNDPLFGVLAPEGPEETRKAYASTRSRQGIQLYRDRKFVCPPDMIEPLRQWCRSRGTNNIIYPA